MPTTEEEEITSYLPREERCRDGYCCSFSGNNFSQQDLMMEILSWLPVRSLFLFKCVAKSWDITPDPYFKMKHHRHHANSTNFLLLHCNFNGKSNFYSTSSLSSR